MHIVNINDQIAIGGNKRFTLLAGPCAIENREMAIYTARTLKQVCEQLGINLVFKASYDKANRSSVGSSRGVGMEKGLDILQEIKESLQLPIVTDVHETWQCQRVAQVADILQIPAFLSRQTDLLIAAAETGRCVNVKKGQFMAPWDMQNVVKKIESTGNRGILLTERGTSFGYNNLIVDMTGLVEMRQLGYPIVFDATHSVQKPSGQGTSTGGNRNMVPYLLRAALAVGVDALFLEVHPNPEIAISDGPNQLYLSNIENILQQAIAIDDLLHSLNTKDNNQPIEIK
ncbi:MAG: 3-deoxy-8-phosphooctulonate synthase [Paludibacteraceae bacterium]|nr:3-deoxy-8-phosphooctulonate synthase [Paludibacteraceae bacterium]